MATAAQDRRNERAREQGYKNDFDRRMHDNGKIPPNEPPLSGDERERARGHRGRADFIRLISSGRDVYVLPVGQERGPDGRWLRIHILVLMPDSTERHFYLKSRPGAVNDPASQASLRDLRDRMNAAGITWVAAPSIDVFSDEGLDAGEGLEEAA